MRHNSYPQHHRRIPIGVVAILVIMALIPLIAVLAWLWLQWARLELLYPLLADVLRFVLFAAPLSLGVGYGYAGLAILWRRYADHRYIQAHHVTQFTKAQRAFPDALHSLSFHDSHKALPAPPHQLEAPELVSAPIPSFAQLLDEGKIGPGRPLILGYNAATGQALTGDWNQLYSCGVGGMTGSGKSWVIAFLAGQSAAAGARIILIDPHAGDPESLANRLNGLSPSYMCDVASNVSAIENALKLASSKLDNRRAGRGGNWPILLIADEWTSMLRGKLGDLLTATALDYAEQGRKYGCFAILGAQAWQVDASGAVRDRLASHYILRTRGDQFRYQTGLRSGNAPEDTLTLPPGQAYLLSTRGDLQRVQIPQMTHADILRLGALVDAPARSPAKFGFVAPTQALSPITASAVTSGRQSGDTMATSAAQIATASQSPEAARALALLHDGKDLPAIVLELRSVRPKEGRKYMTALAEVTDLIRQATKPAGVQS
jgi:uncharacterized protein DUF87